jgi:hypothetical protein
VRAPGVVERCLSWPFGRCASQIVGAIVSAMRTNESIRSQWGIAFYGIGLVMVLVGTVVISPLAVKVWALDDAPVPVRVLLLIGAALLAIGGLCYMALCLRSQVDGLLPRPRHGVLAIGPPRSITISAALGGAGTWIFVIGVIGALADLLYSGKTPRPGFWLVVLALFALVWLGYMLLRVSRIRFVADGWGLRWANPLWPSATQLAWDGIAGIELRGSRLLSMRVVVITNDGRSRLVWAIDPSIPVSTGSIRTIFDEIVALRP